MNKTLKITIIAMLTALSTVANLVSIQISGSNFVSFTYVVNFVAGIYFGPIVGFSVGFLGDLIAGIVHPLGPYNILIGLAAGLLGLIPGLVQIAFSKKNTFENMILSLLACTIICTSGLNTLALWLMYGKGKTFWVYLGARIPFQLLNTLVNGIILSVIIKTKLLDKLVAKLNK